MALVLTRVYSYPLLSTSDVYSCLIRVEICWIYRSSHQEVFLRKDVVKICNKFTREHPFSMVVLL